MLKPAPLLIKSGVTVKIVDYLATILPLLVKWCRRLRNFKFKTLFGKDTEIGGTYHIVYALLILDSNAKQMGRGDYLYRSVDGIKSLRFAAQKAVSSCEMRAASYISNTFGSCVSIAPHLSASTDFPTSLNASLVTLGGLSNLITTEILNNDANTLVKMTHNNFISVQSDRPVVEYESGYDYGLILRIRPDAYPDRVWIVCAGLGEWGTSGSAWYLSNMWRKLSEDTWSWQKPQQYLMGVPFAAIIRVNPGRDRSAKRVALFKTSADVESAANA